MASPSRKNSGLDTTENNFFLTLCEMIFSIWSPVVTGTVDLLIIIFGDLIFLLISFAALYIWLKSAALLFFLVGVPTQIKIIFDLVTASERFDVNDTF